MYTHKTLHRTVIKHLLVYFLELIYQKYWFCDTETLAYYVGSLGAEIGKIGLYHTNLTENILEHH